MNRRLLLAGLGLCVLIPAQVFAEPLYERIKEQVIRDLASGDIDDEVNDFVRAMFRKEHELNKEEVQQMLDGNWSVACGNRPANDSLKNQGVCLEMTGRITSLAEHEQAIRAFGRTLQATATSYELPLSTMPRKTNRILSDLRGILSIWTAGTGSIQSIQSTRYSLLYTVVINDESFKPLIKKVADALKDLNPEQQTAAVWRYQNGVRLIRGERLPVYPPPFIPMASGPGTERQFLFKRWDKVETELKALWDAILTHPFDRPPKKGETLHITFPDDFFSDMPDNIVLWGRLDGDAAGNRADSDVGLLWDTPLETVQPSLLTEAEEEEDRDPILGGAYPVEPIFIDEDDQVQPLDGQGLCTHASANAGYLCRPFELINQNDRCPTPKEPLPPDTISIVTCTKTGSLRFTSAGADVCRDINWIDDKSPLCDVSFTCTNSCPYEGAALAKNEKNVIPLCMRNNLDAAVPATYIMYHELVHAYQKCPFPPGYDPYKDLNKEQKTAACCRVEGEAHQAQFDLMENDGAFKNAGKIDDIPLTASACAEALTHWSCNDRDKIGPCFTSRTYSQSFINGCMQAGKTMNVPKTCKDLFQEVNGRTVIKDERVKQLADLIRNRRDVCTPGQTSQYPNRIGNSMCFIGQCVEQSVETHRVMGGSVPVGVSGEVAPWDNPISGTPLGNAVVNPPVSQGRFPSYRPQLLVRTMETALCQLVGLPPLQPPILCIIEASRQLQTTRTTPADTAQGVVNQAAEEEISTKDILALTPAVASRAGTNLYAVYLRGATRSFSDILSMAGKLLEELGKISFPAEMCPIPPGLPPPLSSDS